MNLKLFAILRSLLCLTLAASFIAPVSVAEISSRQHYRRLNANIQAQESLVSPQQKALTLLVQLPDQTKDFGAGFNSPMKVILFQADVANLLWEYDQPRARSLFTTAMKTAILLRPKVEGAKLPLRADDIPVMQTILNFVLLRDPTFAEQLARLALESYPQQRVPDSGIYWLYLREQTTLYTQIAKHIAAANPQRAAELLRQSFNTSYSYTQLEALNALRRYAPARADEIFLYALTLVKSKPTNLSNKIALFAPYVFPDIGNEVGHMIKESGYAGEAGQVNVTLVKAFLEYVFDNFMPQPVAAQTAENNGFGFASFDNYTMQKLVPHFEQHLPGKAAAYRARVREVIKDIKKADRQDAADKEGEAWEELFTQNVQEMLNQAAVAKTQKERDDIYMELAGLLAYRDADYEQALSIMDKVSDSHGNKDNTLMTIRHMRIEKAIKDGDADKAYAYAKALPDVDKKSEYFRSARPDFLIRTARLYVKKGEREKAKTLLEEAKPELSDLPYDTERASLMLDIASVAVEVAPEFGFQMLKEAITRINEVKETHEGMGVGEGGKITFSGSFDFADNFAPLGRIDFDRALQLARSLKSKEAMLLAQFAICKGVLDS